MNESNFETHGRVFEEEVPVDRILALHRSVGVGKDDLGECYYSSSFLYFSCTLFPLVGSNWLNPSVAKPSPLMLIVPPP